MNFNEETKKAMDKIISEKMPEMIEKKATSMVEDIVSDIFRWGNIKDQIKTKIEESINVNLQKFDLIDYNALISKTINENLLQQINLQPILDMTQNIVGFVGKKEIKLQEILDMFIEASQEENETDGEGEITFIVEHNEKHKWIEIYADIDPDTDKHKCAVKFIFSTEGNRDGFIFSFRTKDEYYDSKQQNIRPSRLVNIGNIEHKIFRLYSAQVKIINYTGHFDNSWCKY